ncbi:MAG: protein kinase [Candidatus Pacebacteria bacterium]|nr:protein kinase [Candidatus Paceibacterota bacterium]
MEKKQAVKYEKMDLSCLVVKGSYSGYTKLFPPIFADVPTSTEITLARKGSGERIVIKSIPFTAADRDLLADFFRANKLGCVSVANDGNNQVFISKYCNASSLDRYIKRKLVLSERDTAEFVRQIAEQLSMLHSAGMYHGDLVPANILVHIDGPNEIKYRICGLGHLTQKKHAHYTSPDVVPYLDPRIVKNPKAELDGSVDMWSLGVMAYQLITGELPQFEEWTRFQNETYLTFQASVGISAQFNHFISACLVAEVDQRMLSRDVRFHPVFIPVRPSVDPYVLGKSLGKGGYAEVFECTSREAPGKRFAIKIIRELSGMGLRERMLVMGETAILLKLKDCPYAVELVDSFVYQGKYHIVTEFCNGNCLEVYACKLWGDAKENAYRANTETRIVAYNLAAALSHLSKLHIMHRDIKPKNILVIVDPVTGRLIDTRLADFGLSKESQSTETVVGTNGYIAPEIVLNELYGCKADVWSYGCTLYSLLYCFNPVTMNSALYSTHDVLYPEDKRQLQLPEQYVSLIKKCIVFDPERRISVDDVLKDPYFTDIAIPVLPDIPPTYSQSLKVTTKTSEFVLSDVATKSGGRLILKSIPQKLLGTQREISDMLLRVTAIGANDSFVKVHDFFASKEQYHFVLDYCDNLTLLSYETTPEEGLDLDMIRHVVRTVVDSVCYLHRRGVTDLRISADTIYLVLGEDKYPRLKLACVEPRIQGLQKTEGGPPEKGEQAETREIRGLGKLVYLLAYGRMPEKEDKPEFPERLWKHEQDAWKVIDLVNICLRTGDTKFSDILKHPLLATK